MKYWDEDKELKSTGEALLKSADEVKVVDPNSPLIKAANEFLNSGNVVDSRIGFSENYNKNRAKTEASAEEVKNYKPTFAGNNFVVTPEAKAKIDSLYTPPPKPRKQTARERYETRQFEYNLEDDPLWQQYISSARRNGQNAMTDTMAKVAAQTGGIAGSYAVAAGAGAYNDYMQRANDIIPELEQLAYRKYQDELNRDLTLYEMEEKEKMEKANEDAIAYKWQSKGDITDDEEVFMRSMGYWFDENGSLVGPDGNRYTTEGGYITDLESKYKFGEQLSSAEIRDLINSGNGYTFEDGVLRKNGEIVNKEFYSPNNATMTDNILWRYISGNQLSPDEQGYLLDRGYEWRDGKLYFGGEEVTKSMTSSESYSLDSGEIPSDLVAAWGEIVDKRGTNKGLSANVYKTLGDYGFVPSSNGQWIHLATGQTLESFFGDSTLTYNPGGGTQSGSNTTPYRKTPSEETVTPAPAPKIDETADYKTYNSVLGSAEALVLMGYPGEAKKLIEDAVNSGKLSETDANRFFETNDVYLI